MIWRETHQTPHFVPEIELVVRASLDQDDSKDDVYKVADIKAGARYSLDRQIGL